MRNLQTAVAQTVDRLEMHATATALLLDVQDKLGGLSREALRITGNGRRPFRPTPGWENALAELSFTILSLADQTGVDLEQAVQRVVVRLSQPAYPPGSQRAAPGPVGPKSSSDDGWPLSY